MKRIAAPDTPVPFSPPLEKAFIPQVEDVVSRAARAGGVLMATGTVIDVVMPQMGVSVSEGTIVKWLKHEGETIEADEPLLEISTDKVDTEVPSPGTGVVAQILVHEGETVDVGDEARRDRAGGRRARRRAPEPEPEPSPSRRLPEPPAEAAAEADAPSSAETPAPAAPQRAPARRAPLRRAACSAPAQPAPVAAGSENGKTFVSPVVARIAAEHGVDVGAVPGTGRGGRVTKKDILAYIARRYSGTCVRRLRPPEAPAPAVRSRRRLQLPAPEPAASAPALRQPQVGRAPRADERDAQGHRRAHAPLARHLRARHERDRGRHVEGGRDPREAQGRRTRRTTA